MIDVRLPDGRIVTNVPEGISRADLVRKLSRNKVITIGEGARMLGVEPVTTDNRKALDESLSGLERFTIGVGRGATHVIQGAQQLALEGAEAIGLIKEGNADRFTQEKAAEREFFEKGDLGTAGTAGRITGQAAATAIPGGAAVRGGAALSGGGRVATALANPSLRVRAGINTAAGGAGGATMFVDEGESRLENAATGALFGAVGGEVLDQLVRRLSAIAKRFKRNRSAQFSERRRAAVEELQGQVPDDALEQLSNDIADGFTSEQALRKFELERLGVQATRGRVTRDLNDLRDEVELSRFQNPVSDVEQSNRQAVLDTLERRAGAEGTALEVGDTVSGALTQGRAAARKVENKAFDKAGDLAERISNRTVSLRGVLNVVDEEIDNLALDEAATIASALKRFGLIDSAGELVSDVTLSPNQANVLRKRLQRASVRGEGKFLKGKLLRALQDDVVRDVGEDVFAEARVRSAKRFARFDNRTKVDAILKEKIAPERIAELVQSKSFSVRDIAGLYDTLGSVSGGVEAKRRLQASIMDASLGALETQQ